MRVAVTGHRDLSPGTADLVRTALEGLLVPHGAEVVGVCCLAPGADQIFAETVLRLGGRLEAIVPARAYGSALPPPDRERFEGLLDRADPVRRLSHEEPTPAVFAAANEVMLADADVLVAVWDGGPSRGVGGTAEVVDAARRRRIRVEILWPEGAERLS
ncbi:hypothetical protein Aph01nite_21230 [Acrocarpospora phusangensis]|uniref:Uncharacterized protein n=1 Tax=Acrocarpospora phusangensis TaxID=1070424 RepID=A0A919Q890_9ACTN|nr:hypothetical protein [Acrocarpospora phusangensis]GIH23813.1 hypothetical protein Aph01nite_21230 [Acrocarpospora phusangensis]